MQPWARWKELLEAQQRLLQEKREKMDLPGREQGSVLLSRHGWRQDTAMLAWPDGPWEAMTTNPELEEETHPISDGDKVGADSPDEDFLPSVSAL